MPTTQTVCAGPALPADLEIVLGVREDAGADDVRDGGCVGQGHC